MVNIELCELTGADEDLMRSVLHGKNAQIQFSGEEVWRQTMRAIQAKFDTIQRSLSETRPGEIQLKAILELKYWPRIRALTVMAEYRAPRAGYLPYQLEVLHMLRWCPSSAQGDRGWMDVSPTEASHGLTKDDDQNSIDLRGLLDL